MSFRSIEFAGGIGSDAELKEINGKTYVKFSVATKNYGEEHPRWIGVMFHRKGVLPFLTKGTQVFVRGPLSIKQTGDKVFFDTFANEVELLSSAKKTEAPAESDADTDFP